MMALLHRAQRPVTDMAVQFANAFTLSVGSIQDCLQMWGVMAAKQSGVAQMNGETSSSSKTANGAPVSEKELA